MKAIASAVVLAGLAFGAVGIAAADEAKTPVSALMLLDIVAAPIESRRSAFDEALRQPAPPPVERNSAEVLPDGSVRYGRTTITVRNPCPPGHDKFEPPPLPGRRR